MHFRGYLTLDVDFAENYASGLEKIKQRYYHLIILDGLKGDCFRICEDIQTLPHGEVFIFSGNSQIEIEAKKTNADTKSASFAAEKQQKQEKIRQKQEQIKSELIAIDKNIQVKKSFELVEVR